MFKYLKVEPHHSKFRDENVLYIDLATHPIDCLKIAPLLTAESMGWEDIDNKLIAEEPDPGTEKGRQEAMERLHERSGAMIVELLNYVLDATGKEVSENSTFQLVDEKDESDDESDDE